MICQVIQLILLFTIFTPDYGRRPVGHWQVDGDCEALQGVQASLDRDLYVGQVCVPPAAIASERSINNAAHQLVRMQRGEELLA